MEKSGSTSAPASPESTMKVSIPFFSGIGAGFFSTLLCNPFDVAKVRLQVQGAMHFDKKHVRYSGLGTLRTIFREEGFRGAFKGLGVALWTIPLFWGIYWQAYDMSKDAVSRYCPQVPSSLSHMISAVGAGAFGNIVVNPFWVVKTRLQTQVYNEGQADQRFLDILKSIYYKEGFPAFYKGLNASFLGLTHVAIQFPLYELLKDTARSYRNSEESFVDLLLASIVAKVVASTVTYPHEVLRARLQYNSLSQKLNIVEVVADILRNDGMRGLYSGYTLNLIRIAPSTVSTFMAYEYISRYLKSRS